MPLYQDQFLSDKDRASIHDFALTARKLLITEVRDLLEGVYGLKADGRLAPLDHLPNLSGDPEGQETYRWLGTHLEDEVKAGLDRQEVVDKLVKEVAFTHLNRLVAFKMMETRGLIKQAIGKGTKSNRFLFYLVDHPEDEALWKAGGENLDKAYRHFLLWQAGQVAQEIRVLFDPDNLPSRLFPRSNALYRLIDMINAEDLSGVWQADETIGWVYQYFNEPELQAAFAAVRQSGVKFEASDIPAATQLFTLKWIVRFLVENTLGRLWVQMHPDSCLVYRLEYLVPLADEQPPEPLRQVKEITLLDPACGSMHFGLVAFDLFYVMYQEELERAGQPGWPVTPSVASDEEIASAIVKNNLFGIDIDLRAVQLSALTLYLKAKSTNPNASLSDNNLACADVLAINGVRLDKFLSEMQFRPIYERLLRRLWEKLGDITQLGSLLRLESEIGSLIEVERRRFLQEGRQLDMFGKVQQEFEFEAAQEEYWQIMEGQLIQGLDEFSRKGGGEGYDERLFTQEAAKGLRVLDLMLRKYDMVVTNPPYLSRRKMNKDLSDLLDDQYPEGKADLYAAFIMRNLEFAQSAGYVGMLTMHSFMFISSYEALRKHITGQASIQTLAHLGPGLFATGNPGTLQTAAFVLRREPDPARRAASVGTYFRLVHEPDAESKRLAFERALAELKAMEGDTAPK